MNRKLKKEKLSKVMRALNDWIITYAPDQFDEFDVVEAKKRINKYGTLAYVSYALQDLDEVMKAIEKEWHEV